MAVILITNWIAARAARNLAESMSSDPKVRAAARIRAMEKLMRRERQLLQPQLAEVVYLDTWIAALARASWRSTNPQDY